MHDVEQIEQELRELVEGMSHEALEAWDDCLRIVQDEGRNEDKLADVMGRLSPADYEDLGKAFALKQQQHAALLAQYQGEKHLFEQLNSVCRRALELEPSLARDGFTVGKALAVLERHGIRHGISPEISEMQVMVPRNPRKK